MSERDEARRDGAKLQKNSGRGQYQKADATMDDWSIDYKEYEKSFSISRKVWAKTCSDALRNGIDFIPVLKIILGKGAATIRLAIVEWSYLEYLKGCERELNEIRQEGLG